MLKNIVTLIFCLWLYQGTAQDAHIQDWSLVYGQMDPNEPDYKAIKEGLEKKLGKDIEIQVLAPMKVGSMGTTNLNQLIQEACNPEAQNKPSLQIGSRTFRVGDRVIQRRNNYDLEVFNGDIGNV